MGYPHGSEWTDEKIMLEIEKVMESLNICRMPSRSELEMVMGDSALSNKISKTGGYYKWAKRMGVEVKDSATKRELSMSRSQNEK